MKTITMYEANDGSRWERAEQAAARDMLIDRCAEVMTRLRPRPDHRGFENGHGYCQQSASTVRSAKGKLIDIARERFPKSAQSWPHDPDEISPFSIVGRVICDDDDPFSRSWHRIMCIDEFGREWGQPYYALHPDEGENMAL